MNPASGQLHDDQEIKGDQTVFGPNLDCREIDGGQYIPMSLEERLPGGLSPPLRRRLDAMLLQDVSHAGIGDLMTQVGQGALNAVITPGRIFPGEPAGEDEVEQKPRLKCLRPG